MRLKFHQKSGSSEFPGILEFQHFNILPEMNRSWSQLPVELWILKLGPVSLVRFSKFKFLQKAGTEIYTYLQEYKSFENPEKSHAWLVD